MSLGALFTTILNGTANFFAQPAPAVIFQLFVMGGWAIFAWLLLYAAFYVHVYDYKHDKAIKNWQWVLLAIDIPPLNVQTPKAVEQLFAHLAGALQKPDIAQRFRHGFKQRWFSFEIISIEGYIQFLIRTEVMLRDLVESAIYAQYPEAEITEVEDYVESVPDHFPNDTHDIWAADFALAEKDAFPIRTYREFEHTISKDTILKDPMGTFLESFTRIGPGEQVWFQIIVEPISNSWKEKAIQKVQELIGDTTAHAHGKKNISDMIADLPIKLLGGVSDRIFGALGETATHVVEKPEEPNKIRYLTPGQTKVVEAIEEKISKIGFKTKMRAIYVAKKQLFRPERAVNAIIGAINQFNIPSANSIIPKFGVRTSYLFKTSRSNYKKTLLMKAYIKRKPKTGATPFILNIEELATVWHFPMSHVKTPLLQKAIGKRAEPPAGLPVGIPIGMAESLGVSAASFGEKTEGQKEEGRATYQTDSGDIGYRDEDVRLG